MKTRVLVLACLIGVAAATARADWIVTRDGESFEIKGSWQLKGKLAVFTLPDGTLSSIRADRIDSEASKRLADQIRDEAAAAAAPPHEDAKPPRKSVIVLTDKDFVKAPPPAEAAGASAGDKAKPPGAADARAAKPDAPLQEVPQAVEIANWSRLPASEAKIDGLEIKGTLRNASQRYLTEVTAAVSLFDDTGTILGIFPATVENQVLPPGESTAFHLAAGGVYAFATLRWETHGRAFRELPEPQAPAAGAAPAAARPAPAPAPEAPVPPPASTAPAAPPTSGSAAPPATP